MEKRRNPIQKLSGDKIFIIIITCVKTPFRRFLFCGKIIYMRIKPSLIICAVVFVFLSYAFAATAQTQQPVWCHTFFEYLVFGSHDSPAEVNGEVSSLQIVLLKEGLLTQGQILSDNVAEGSPAFLGSNTLSALKQFQSKYGISQTGTTGPITRAKLNSIYGCRTVYPAISSITTTAVAGTYNAGASIPLTVNFSKPVSGSVIVTLNTIPSRTCKFTIINATSGGCTYVVQPGDITHGVSVLTAYVSGIIKDQAGSAMTNFMPASNLSPAKAIHVDAASLVVSSITTTASAGTYNAGASIPLTVNFSKPVSGNVSVVLNTTPSETCSLSVKNQSRVTCNYVVPDGDSTAGKPLDVSVSGNLKDQPGNLMASLTPIASLSSVKKIIIGPYTNVPVTSITLNKTSDTITYGASDKLTATIIPSNATDTKVNWTSNNINVATVDSNGNVKAIATGAATITATADDKTNGIFSAETTVNIVSTGGGGGGGAPISVTGVTLSQNYSPISSINIALNGTATIEADILPLVATDRTVNWTITGDTNAVAILQCSPSNNGPYAESACLIQGNNAGTSTITATTDDGAFTASVVVTVGQAIPVTGITLGQNTVTYAARPFPFQLVELTATIKPSKATDKNITWTSNNASVATVDSYGQVTAVTSGTATITATTEDGSFSDSDVITISPIISVTKVTLSQNLDTIIVGSQDNISATIAPVGATYNRGYLYLTWTSSDPTIATVSSDNYGDAVVTAVAPGTATITATSVDTTNGTISDQDVITVTASSSGPPTVAVTGLTLNEHSVTLGDQGHTDQLVAMISPSNATDQKVNWVSSNLAVASVDSNGFVHTFTSYIGFVNTDGTATITATADDKTNGTISDQDVITVANLGDPGDGCTQDSDCNSGWCNAGECCSEHVCLVYKDPSKLNYSLASISGVINIISHIIFNILWKNQH